MGGLESGLSSWQIDFPDSTAGRSTMRESFEHFYLTKIGLGEGCGCAEHVTRIREIETYAAKRGRGSAAPGRRRPLLELLAKLFRRRETSPATRAPETS
jgi:hypothetical protein